MSVGLIDYLRNWGESLFTSKKAYIAQQSLPTESFVSQVSVPNDEGDHSYISPIDGWVQYIPTNGSTTNVQLHYQNVHSVMASGTPFTFYGFVPVQKGVAVIARSSGDSGVLLFIRSIGGGDNKILQAIGGGLCYLSQSFNRFSSSAEVKHIQQAKESQSTCRQAVLSRRTMGISSSEQTLPMGKTLLSMLGGLFLCRLTVQKFVTHVLQYLVQKDKLFISAQVVLSTLRHSFRQKARLSFCEGGAL